MRIEQKIILAYSFLGIISGFISVYYSGFFSFILPIPIYLIPSLIFFSRLKAKRKKSLIIDSLITFVLVWIFVWILLYNYG
jgi:H+/Cl- antiporter ClcA